MTYPYEDQGGGNAVAEEAHNIQGAAGACPPKTLVYRIYPVFDFNEIFGDPPPTVNTQ